MEILQVLQSLASLARNSEFCLVSRKTSKVQEIAHYTLDSCISHSNDLVSLSYPMPTFSKNSFRLLCINWKIIVSSRLIWLTKFFKGSNSNSTHPYIISICLSIVQSDLSTNLVLLNSCWMKRLSLFGGRYRLRSLKFLL